MQKEQRIALIIGNNKYSNLSNLKNPINDARIMKNVLKKRGFKVIYKENASKRDMKKLIKKFAYQLKSGGIGLYYFAGHGINVSGHNFLIGIDSVIDDRDEIEFETLALNYVTKKMKDAGNRLNIVILDACRNDPFSRSGGGGLAPVSNARGMLVAYATEAGSVASDGRNGENGVFTKYLVKNIKEKGASIERVFKNTRSDVYDATNGKQSPGVYNQIRGDFFFTLPSNFGKKTTKIETKDSSYKLNDVAPESFSLTITPSPSDAKVSITNIQPKYYAGMELESGDYNIKVSKNGFITKTGIINLYSNINVKVLLKEKIKRSVYTPAKKSYKPTYKPVKKSYSRVSSRTTVNGATCKSCHGTNWDKNALGKSKKVSYMTHTEIANALIGYKTGTYGRAMKGLMKGQVAKYSTSDLEAFAQTIGR